VTITVLFPPRSKCLPVKKEFWRDSQAEFEVSLRQARLVVIPNVEPREVVAQSDVGLLRRSLNDS
jgi:hypothetical protein